MSGNWETVTKSRKTRSSTAAAAAGENGSNGKSNGSASRRATTVKMEDIIPRDKLHSIFVAGPRSDSPPTAKKTTNSASNSSSAKPKLPDALIPAQKQPKTSAPLTHRPKYRNLEAALAALDANEVLALLASYRATYANQPIAWLQAIITHLNNRLYCDYDPTFVGRSPNYPLNNLQPAIAQPLTETLALATAAQVELFFQQTLQSVPNDMVKNLPVIGQQLLLLLIAKRQPAVVVKQLPRLVAMRQSYQNRPVILLSALWTVRSGGLAQIAVGLELWREVLQPLLEVKAYSAYAADYVRQLMRRWLETEETAGGAEGFELSAEQMFAVYDDLRRSRQGLASDVLAKMAESANVLLSKYIEWHPKITPVFMALFDRLGELKSGSRGQLQLADNMVECLEKDAGCLKVWRIQFRKYAAESAVLLRVLEGRNNEFTNSAPFAEFLAYANGVLAGISDERKYSDLSEMRRIVKSSQDKSAQNKAAAAAAAASGSGSCRRCCGWTIGIVTLFVAIGLALAYDTHIHGNVFAKSATGKLLAQAGVLPHVERGWVATMGPAARGYQWAEQHVPHYARTAQAALHPYALFVRDLALVAWSAVQRAAQIVCGLYHEKQPAVVAYIEGYAPGLPQKVSEASVQLWTNVRSTSIQLYASGFEFFKTKVFVGQLSPESLNQALNRTLVASANLNKWFHSRVEVYSKY